MNEKVSGRTMPKYVIETLPRRRVLADLVAVSDEVVPLLASNSSEGFIELDRDISSWARRSLSSSTF